MQFALQLVLFVMAEEINARLVGTEFVRHYYTMLNERPDCLHL